MNFIFISLFCVSLARASTNPEDKIDESLKNLKSNSKKDIFVQFNGGSSSVFEQINNEDFSTREDKINAMNAALSANSIKSQEGVVKYLNSNPFASYSYSSFPTSNEIYIKNADSSLIKSLSQFDEVSSVREEEIIQLSNPINQDEQENEIQVRANGQVEWGVKAVKADQVWQFTKGEGIIACIVDTGVSRDHKDLKENYAGTNGWLDPITRRANPFDNQGHGTHVAGIVVGRNGIGIAPGAKWIACRGCNEANCMENHLKRCLDFCGCPKKSDGQCDASKVAHVVNNSWGGDGGSKNYNDNINALNSINIAVVFAAGNEGDNCKTMGSPGDQPGVIGVASTTDKSEVSDFSSRGPTIDGRMKPDIAAPGSKIQSASNTNKNGYQTMSGTSMASPHVAGVICLLKVKNPKLNTEDSKKILQKTAYTTNPIGKTCGDIPDSKFPNNHVGYGITDALKAWNTI